MRNPCLLPVVLVLVSAAARAAAEESGGDLDFSAEALSKRFQALQPDIEEALQEKLEGPVEVIPATREEIAGVIAAENLEMLSELEGGPRGAALSEFCKEHAVALSSAMFAKLDTGKNTLLIAGENFASQAAAGGEAYAKVLSPEFLDLILIHESFYVDKKLKIKVLDVEQTVHSLVIGHRRFVLEVMAVYTPETREDLEALAKKLAGLLDEALAAPPEEAGSPAKTAKGKEE